MTYLKVIICLDCSTGKQPMQSDDEKRPDDSKRVAIGSASNIKTTQSSPLLSNTALGMFYSHHMIGVNSERKFQWGIHSTYDSFDINFP